MAMKRNSSLTIIICGLASILATVIFYLLAFDHIFTIPMRWVSLTWLMLVEILGTVKALTVNRSILGTAQLVTSGLHLTATLVLSLLFVNLFPLKIQAYNLISVLLLIVVAVIDVLLVYFNGNARRNAEKYTASASVIDACQAKAQQLLIEHKESVYRSQLNSILELLTYANRGMAGPNDNEIFTKVSDLDNILATDDKDTIIEELKSIQNLLKLRIQLTKKTGSF